MSHLFSTLEKMAYRDCSNGRQAVGDGAASFDNGSDVLAVCHLQGMNDVYYYSTTFSGGPGVSIFSLFSIRTSLIPSTVAFLTPLKLNALPTEGRQTV